MRTKFLDFMTIGFNVRYLKIGFSANRLHAEEFQVPGFKFWVLSSEFSVLNSKNSVLKYELVDKKIPNSKHRT
jgi:hypothetical protein